MMFQFTQLDPNINVQGLYLASWNKVRSVRWRRRYASFLSFETFRGELFSAPVWHQLICDLPDSTVALFALVDLSHRDLDATLSIDVFTAEDDKRHAGLGSPHDPVTTPEHDDPLVGAVAAYLDDVCGRIPFRRLDAHVLPVIESRVRAALCNNGFCTSGVTPDATYWHGSFHDVEHLELRRAAGHARELTTSGGVR